MKKWILVLAVLAFAAGLAFGAAQDWTKYRQAKELARAAGNTAERVEAYGWAAEAAAELGRPDIQAWQYNNAGHILIQQFMLDVAWVQTMEMLNETAPSSAKMEKIDAYKKYVRDEMPTLESAKSWLLKAKDLNQKASAGKIKSNLDFIAFVEKFCK